MRLGGVGSDATVVGRGPELFFFVLEQEPMVLRELSRLGPSTRAHGELLLLLMQKKPNFVPDSKSFNSYIGDGFLVPKLKDESEASKDEQAGSSSENNVGNGALFVIVLHGSGDISGSSQRREIRHAAWILTRYNVRRDTRMSPYEKIRGQKYTATGWISSRSPSKSKCQSASAAMGDRPLVGT